MQEYLACATSLGSVICYIPKVYVSAVLWTDNVVVRIILPWNCVTGNGGVGCKIGKA